MAVLEHLKSNLTLNSYLFWLIAVSLFCFVLERVRPWRRDQSWRRPQLLQDLFFLVFNGHLFSLLVALSLGSAFQQMYRGCDWCCVALSSMPRLFAGWPLWIQVVFFFLAKDFLEYVIHYLLHRVPWLWAFHKLHHSIETMDWIGNFRFHWMEVFVYDLLKWLPLVLLGAEQKVLLCVGVASTLIGHLNHTNIRYGWGPLRYVFNSPRMHLWHHDYILHKKAGQNFAVVFSVWDWLFGTAYLPDEPEGPERLGFHGMKTYPKSLLARITYPAVALFRRNTQ